MRRNGPAWREAIVLPWLLLVVALLGSLRFTLDGELRVVPPALSAFVLMLPFVGVLVRCGQMVPADVFGAERGVLAGAGSVTVLAALGWASASVLSLVTPESGLPRAAVLVLLAALLLNTLAAAPGRIAALRALFVACLTGFVVKFIMLDALFDPARGLGGRIATALLEGVTLGGLSYTPWAPVTGYLAFATVVLFFVALLALPRGGLHPALQDGRLDGPDGNALIVTKEDA